MQLRQFEEPRTLAQVMQSKVSPMMKISNGSVTYYQSFKEKIEALTERESNDKFVIAWNGQWRTDVFDMPEDIIEMVLEAAK
jgi:hypothetical protein